MSVLHYMRATGLGMAEAATDNRLLDSAMTTVVGTIITGTGTGTGISLLADTRLLNSAMIIAVGVATVGGGIANLTNSRILGSAGVIGIGGATAGGGIAVLIRSTGLTTRLWEWRAALTQDPTSKEPAAQTSGREQGASDAQPPREGAVAIPAGASVRVCSWLPVVATAWVRAVRSAPIGSGR
ncbi:hypothetical protein [Micromonospora sp. DT233]|uniref:hypothetical protein n=1 Tax=Micromonospora sp. DT233 TaxID=3393432 RepID=UPI003CF655A4